MSDSLIKEFEVLQCPSPRKNGWLAVLKGMKNSFFKIALAVKFELHSIDFVIESSRIEKDLGE